MSLETIDDDNCDSHAKVDALELDQEPDLQATIEGFTGVTLEYLMRVGYAVASRKLWSKEDREDAVQEAFKRVLASARRRTPAPVDASGYFATIVLNVIRDELRAQFTAKRGGGVRPRAIDENIQVADPRPTPAHSVQNAELRREILAAIETLPPAHREVLDLALDIDSGDFNRMSHTDIADKLGLEPKRVKSRLHEAKKKLASCLAGWRNEERS